MIILYCILAWLAVGFITAYCVHVFLEPEDDKELGDVLKLTLMGLVTTGIVAVEIYKRKNINLLSKIAFKGKRK